MSFHAEIQGEIRVPEEARDFLSTLETWRFVKQEGDAEESEVEMTAAAGEIILSPSGVYRNLGRIVDCDVARLVERFPTTKAAFWIFSTDGGLTCESYSAEGDGKLWRRCLGEPHEVMLTELVSESGTRVCTLVPKDGAAQEGDATTSSVREGIWREVTNDPSQKPDPKCPYCGGRIEYFPDQDGSCDYDCNACGWHEHEPAGDDVREAKGEDLEDEEEEDDDDE